MFLVKNRIRAMKGKKDDERKNAIIEIKEVQHCMSNVLPVEDLSKTYLEHAMVINNFVIKIGSQIKARFDLGEY